MRDHREDLRFGGAQSNYDQEIKNDDDDVAGQSIGSLEKQIQQIVLSRDLLQNMDIDLNHIKMKEAGSVLEPSDAQARCMMLRQNMHDDEDFENEGSSMR